VPYISSMSNENELERRLRELVAGFRYFGSPDDAQMALVLRAARIGAEIEREACAEVCDQLMGGDVESVCGHAIRARSTK
jgi:hypothetical protein